MKVRSIVPYYGGKARMAPLIAEMLDYDNTDIYVEPFGGGCRVLLNKPRHKIECYNDYGEGICAVMRVMSNPDTASEFIERLGETEYSKEEFDKAKELYDLCENDPEELSRRKLLRILSQPQGHGVKRATAQLLLSAQKISAGDPALVELSAWQKNNPDLWEEFSAEYENWYELFWKKLQQGCLERPRDLYGAPVTDMDLAIATYITFIQSRDAMGETWSAYRYKNNDAYHNHMVGLYECAERMEGVQVYQIDAMNFFRWGGSGGQITEWLNNPRVMMYLDPSYISPEWEQKALEGIDVDKEPCLSEALAKNPKNLGMVYATSFSYADQEEFLRRICDAKCKLLVSNYDLASVRYRRQQVRIFNDLMHKTYVWVALASACRRGELAGLRVDGVDFENNLIRITETGHYEPTAGLYDVKRMKNGAPSNTVDMPVSVMKQLKVYLDARQNLFDLMDWEDSGYAFISLNDGNVTKAGGQIMPDVLSKWFSRFLQKYELPKITLHEVRHTSISYLINRGVDVKMIADRANHQNTRTTEEIYSHIFAKTRRATANEYDDLFSSRVAQG